jgi:pyrimidine-specific ribonucleoside hydrolase
MRNIFYCLALSIFMFSTPSWAHEELTPAIVDTDMALDDVRAILLMLNSQQLKVKSIVTSDGASSPGAGCRNLRRILHFLGREEIPVGAGRELNIAPPPWRGMSEALGWAHMGDGNDADSKPSLPEVQNTACPDSVAVILKTLSEAGQGVSYICIGPMTNLADLLKREPGLGKRIKNIFYYGALPDDPNPEWNTSRDMEAARSVFSAGIPIFVVRPSDMELLTFDPALLSEIRKIDSQESRLLSLMYENEKTGRLLAEGHFKAWDESVPLYLDNPEIASFVKVEGKNPVFRLSQWESAPLRAAYLAIIGRTGKGKIEERIPVVLDAYPVEPSRFQKDLQPWVSRIIAANGVEEWKATVLTNELHRHLGIYSIIGAKMGILAREILNASLDDLKVESRAGLKPPYSCLNDGLQVSTGASLGRGTITVPETGKPAVEAVFSKGNRRLRLLLKEGVRERITSDIRKAVQTHGDLTPEYFREVRRLSFDYWMNLKRSEIFEREFVSP